MTVPEMGPGKRQLAHVEVSLRTDRTASAPVEEVRAATEAWLKSFHRIPTVSGPLILPFEQRLLSANVQSIFLDFDESGDQSGAPASGSFFLPWEVTWRVHVFTLDSTGPEDDDEGEDDAPSFRSWLLPAADFHGLWSALHYDSGITHRLLRYADSTLLFSDCGVSPHLVSFGRIVLLHGPPGTGKTSLCKALAQKLAIRMRNRYPVAELVEVNAHSLFSRWFSESGKLMAKLFESVKEKLEDPGALVFVLVHHRGRQRGKRL